MEHCRGQEKESRGNEKLEGDWKRKAITLNLKRLTRLKV